jgi:hypothetical protein
VGERTNVGRLLGQATFSGEFAVEKGVIGSSGSGKITEWIAAVRYSVWKFHSA